MVKGIINAFDRTELCFVINLTKNGNWTITRPPIFATGYVSFAATFLYQVHVASTCYQQKKLISNTADCNNLPALHIRVTMLTRHDVQATIFDSCL